MPGADEPSYGNARSVFLMVVRARRPGPALDEPNGRTSHIRGIAVMLLGTAASYAVTILLLGSRRSLMNSSALFDIWCFEFLGWWWFSYFALSHMKARGQPRWYSLFTLRSFLDQISSHRAEPKRPLVVGDDDQLNEQLIREKAISSRDVQGIMIAVVVLLLTLIVIDLGATGSAPDQYQRVIRAPLFALALTIILVWVLSLDIFDTILNSFQVHIHEAYSIRRYYYRKIGPLYHGQDSPVFGGGVSYGYLGHALMPVFVLMVFSWFEPGIVGLGTALYIFLAYPYYYGYWVIDVRGFDRSGAAATTPSSEFTIERTAETLRDDPDGWLINRDGDRAVRMENGKVLKFGDSGPKPAVWPPLLLGFAYFIASVYFVTR